MVYESVPGFCREFLFYKRNVQNLSQKTVDQYYLDMKLFFQWLADENGIKSPSVEAKHKPNSPANTAATNNALIFMKIQFLPTAKNYRMRAPKE